jgi:hypothetical protein
VARASVPAAIGGRRSVDAARPFSTICRSSPAAARMERSSWIAGTDSRILPSNWQTQPSAEKILGAMGRTAVKRPPRPARRQESGKRMNHPLCQAGNCTSPATWALIPGFDTGRGTHLCRKHWQEIQRQSNVEADCYRKLSCADERQRSENGTPSRIGPFRSKQRHFAHSHR